MHQYQHQPEKYEKITALELYKSKYYKDDYISISAETTVFLMLGLISPYKGIHEIVELFPRDMRGVLIVAGGNRESDNQYCSEIKINASKTNNIIVINQFIPENDLPIFYNLSDVVIFNFKEILTSGAVIMARNYGKKVIVPNKGCLRDLPEADVIKFQKMNQIVFNKYFNNLILELA